MRGLVPHDRVCEMRSGAGLASSMVADAATPSLRAPSSVQRARARRRPRRSSVACLGPRARSSVRAACGRSSRLAPHGEGLAGASRSASARFARLRGSYVRFRETVKGETSASRRVDFAVLEYTDRYGRAPSERAPARALDEQFSLESLVVCGGPDRPEVECRPRDEIGLEAGQEVEPPDVAVVERGVELREGERQPVG